MPEKTKEREEKNMLEDNFEWREHQRQQARHASWSDKLAEPANSPSPPLNIRLTPQEQRAEGWAIQLAKERQIDDENRAKEQRDWMRDRTKSERAHLFAQADSIRSQLRAGWALEDIAGGSVSLETVRRIYATETGLSEDEIS